jgi:hypothetical protein
MKSRLIVLVLGCAAVFPAFAGEIACPDLASAVQVATCPSEEELKYTYTGYCSDNARLYGKDKETCATYENYRKLKNVVLWESADGAFHAYLSCNLAPAAIKAAKPRRVEVGKAGQLTRVACDYGDDIVFAHRTRAACKPAGDGACVEGKPCKAGCD